MTTRTTPATRHEILVGLRVSDEAGYARYRQLMTPLLHETGAYFRYDMRVSELLKGEADEPFNRVFIISFPDEDAKIAYFADERYKAIKSEHFQRSVSSVTQLAAYDTAAS